MTRQTTVYSHIPEYAELTGETLVSLQDACQQFPIKISRPCIERYWRHGQRGVLLRTCFLAGRRYTSVEEIERFIKATQRTGNDHAAIPVASLPKRDINAARRKYNLPAAGRNGQPAE